MTGLIHSLGINKENTKTVMHIRNNNLHEKKHLSEKHNIGKHVFL